MLGTVIFLLFVNGKISTEEADKLQDVLALRAVPRHWRDVMTVIEEELERPLIETKNAK